MKPAHDYYDLKELKERWSEFFLTEKDILKYGVSGKLQFSFRVHSGSDTFNFIYGNGNLSDGEEFYCDEIDSDRSKKGVYNISAGTVNNILKAESDYIKNDIPSEVDLKLKIPCPSPKCKIPNRATTCDLVYSGFPIMDSSDGHYVTDYTCNRFDLIVTHENVLAFEETYIKPEPEEKTPPYLDPDNEFYSVTLDLAVKAWKAIFEDRKHLDSNSAGIAGATYLKSRESGCAELSKKYNIELTDTLAENIAKIAVGEYSPNKPKWNNFRNQK
jgi:hypothetical protein